MPVRRWISRASRSASPPSRFAWPGIDSPMIDSSPPAGIAPSATTTIENSRPARSRARIFSQTFSMSNGISGIRMTSAVAGEAGVERDESGVAPHDLEHDDAVVALRGRVQLVDRVDRGVTAVSKPNVLTVHGTSLSIVFGTQTTFIPLRDELLRDARATRRRRSR